VGPADQAFYREVGLRIRNFRTERHFTQAGLGQRLHPPLTRAAIANIEHGKQRLLAHTLAQLAHILAVDLKDLVPSVSVLQPAAIGRQTLERELKKKLTVSQAALKRLATRFEN
jgi:transcriptional regulator with XRE-family HTH domain